MKRWEYRIVDSEDVAADGIFRGKNRQAVEVYLNEFGEQGWEIINVDWRELEGRMSFTGVAKREKR